MFKKRKANSAKVLSLLFVPIIVGWLGLIHFGNADLIDYCGTTDNTTTPVKNYDTSGYYCYIEDDVQGNDGYNHEDTSVYDLQDDHTLQCWGDEQVVLWDEWDGFTEDITFDRYVQFTLSGGWNSDFSSHLSDFSTIEGSLEISDGTVTVENIIIQSPM